MTETPNSPIRLRLADLSQRKPHHFNLAGDAPLCERITHALNLSALRKLSFAGSLRAVGKTDWQLDANLGATVVQPCVVTLAPVTTRIDTQVTRRYLRDWHEPIDADEIEMPEDDTTEPLPAVIDLEEVLTEALALALPDYPKAPDADLEETAFAPEGVTPLSDEDTKPFAALAALKDKLDNPDD